MQHGMETADGTKVSKAPKNKTRPNAVPVSTKNYDGCPVDRVRDVPSSADLVLLIEGS